VVYDLQNYSGEDWYKTTWGNTSPPI
jgi:hypothetical protein